MLKELAIAILGDVLTVLGTFFLVWLPYVSNKRRKQLKFFGLDRDHQDIVVYLSGVPVDFAGKAAPNSKLLRGFKGTLVGKIESEAANLISAYLSRGFLAYFAVDLKDFTADVTPHFRNLNVSIRISPDADLLSAGTQLSQSNTICLGNHIYNAATREYQESLSCFFKFRESGGELCVETPRAGGLIETFEGRRVRRELAIVQRLKDHNAPNHMVFICAGTGQDATKGAVQYLLDNWEGYQRKYKDGEFGVCLAFTHKNSDSDDIAECHPLLELPASNADRGRFPSTKPEYRNYFLYEFRFPNDLDLMQVERHHRSVIPFLKRAAEAVHVNDGVSYVVGFMNDGNRVYFNLLEGAINNGEHAFVGISYDAFCQLIFIDFGKWKCGADLEKHLRRQHGDKLREHVPGALSLLCGSWFELYKAAAEAFFESEKLVPYFQENVSSWWNEGVTFSENHFNYQAKIERNIRLGGKDVLELGCGYGRLRKLFAIANRSVHVDTSPELLKLAMEKNKNANATFVQADINCLPKDLTDDSFDSIILLQICMHLRDPFGLLGSASGILTSKGEICVDFTCATCLTKDWYQESFFTRIYKEAFIIERIENLGMKICKEIKMEDRLGHYWLLVCLMKAE